MANSRRCFLGENGRPLRLFCRRIDAGQYCSNKCFDYNSSDIKFCKLSVSSTSVVGIIMDIQSEGSWLESARTIDIFTVSYTFKLKAHGSNPLNNSRGVPVYYVSQYDSLPWFLYLSLLYVKRIQTRSLQNCKITKIIDKCLYNFLVDSNQCPSERLSRMLPLSYKTVST